MGLCRKNIRNADCTITTGILKLQVSEGIITDLILSRVETCRVCNNKMIIAYIDKEEIWKCKVNNRTINTLITETCPNKMWRNE